MKNSVVKYDLLSLGRRFLWVAVLMVASLSACGQVFGVDTAQFESHRHIVGSDTLPYRLYTSACAEQTVDSPQPLVIFLHGAGERGNDNVAQFTHCIRFFADSAVSQHYPFRLLLPQCPIGKRWVDTDWRLPSHQMDPNPTPQMSALFYLIDSLVASGAADTNRIYITGISMGSFGVWDALQRRPATFAAAIPVCGGGDTAYASRLLNVPINIYHGLLDKLVKPSRSMMMYGAIRKAGGSKVHITNYKDLGHLCWDRVFSDPTTFDWLFNQVRGQED